MDDAQKAANEEGKNSAGDKYETGRAMMQIERDKAARQLDEALKLKSVLDQINADVKFKRVSLGSLVITNTKKVFISIGIGKLNVEGVEYLVVAPASPFGMALMGLMLEDKFTFNKETHIIQDII